MHLTNNRSSPEWFGENTDCGSREEINKLTLRFLGWASSHQQTWTIEWKQTLNNRWSQQRRYVTGRLQWYPQDTAESFVKWSSAGLLHSPALFKKEEEGRKKKEVLHLSRCYTHTHTRQSRGNPERQEEEKSGHTTGRRPKTAQGGGEQTDLRNQPTRPNGPDKNRAHT